MREIEDHGSEVDRAVGQLSRLLVSEGTFKTAMDHIAELAVAAVPHCDACSVSTLLDGQFKTMASSDRLAERVTEHEYQTDEGPCLDAIRTGEEHKIDSMVDSPRWTRFTALAAREGVRSCYAVPLRVRSETLGAVNLYSLGSPFNEFDERVGPIFAEQAAVTLSNAVAYRHIKDAVDNLNLALASRDLIGQAKGIIMARDQCSSEQAFETLRSISQARNIKLRDLAQEIVTGSSHER